MMHAPWRRLRGTGHNARWFLVKTWSNYDTLWWYSFVKFVQSYEKPFQVSLDLKGFYLKHIHGLILCRGKTFRTLDVKRKKVLIAGYDEINIVYDSGVYDGLIRFITNYILCLGYSRNQFVRKLSKKWFQGVDMRGFLLWNHFPNFIESLGAKYEFMMVYYVPQD